MRSEDRDGHMPLAGNSGIEILAWFPTLVRPQDEPRDWLDSQVRLTRWLGWVLHSVIARAAN